LARPESTRHRVIDDDHRRRRWQIELVEFPTLLEARAQGGKELRGDNVVASVEMIASRRRLHSGNNHGLRLSSFFLGQGRPPGIAGAYYPRQGCRASRQGRINNGGLCRAVAVELGRRY